MDQNSSSLIIVWKPGLFASLDFWRGLDNIPYVWYSHSCHTGLVHLNCFTAPNTLGNISINRSGLKGMSIHILLKKFWYWMFPLVRGLMGMCVHIRILTINVDARSRGHMASDSVNCFASGLHTHKRANVHTHASIETQTRPTDHSINLARIFRSITIPITHWNSSN